MSSLTQCRTTVVPRHNGKLKMQTDCEAEVHTELSLIHSSTWHLQAKTAPWSWNTHYTTIDSRIQTFHWQQFVCCRLHGQLWGLADHLDCHGGEFVREQQANVLSRHFVLNDSWHQRSAFVVFQQTVGHRSQKPQIKRRIIKWCNATQP